MISFKFSGQYHLGYTNIILLCSTKKEPSTTSPYDREIRRNMEMSGEDLPRTYVKHPTELTFYLTWKAHMEGSSHHFLYVKTRLQLAE
jgi:hypothetical protein